MGGRTLAELAQSRQFELAEARRRPPFVPVLSLLLRRRALLLFLLVAVLLQVTLLHLGLPAWQCPFHAVTGLPCPGCGLSRAAWHLLQGHWAVAFQLHPFAPLVVAAWAFLACCSVLPAGPRAAAAGWVGGVERRTGVSFVLLAALVAYGLVRMVLEVMR